MFLNTEHAKAIQCYRDVLKEKPNNYKALQKIIGLLRRAGQLSEVQSLYGLRVEQEKYYTLCSTPFLQSDKPFKRVRQFYRPSKYPLSYLHLKNC